MLESGSRAATDRPPDNSGNCNDIGRTGVSSGVDRATETFALDLAQDVLERVYAQWGRVSRADHPYAYARRIAVNTHLNNTRRQLATVATDPAEFDGAVDQVEPDDTLWRALATISPRQRAALVLRFYEDCTESDIAAVLNCRPATVRSLVARGLATLRASELLRSEP